MPDDALSSLRTRAQAVARLYFDVLWPDEGVPEISSGELAKFKRAAVRTGRECLAASTGWDPDQILYDPLVKTAIVPLDPETLPPYFPDEVRFGLRALEKEPDFWKDKLATIDQVIPHEGPGVIALEGEAGVISRYVFAPPSESFLTSFRVAGTALASPLGQPATFMPVGYDTAVMLTDQLVYVVPVSRPAEVGRLSYSDMLAVSEERRMVRSRSSVGPSRPRAGATPSPASPAALTKPTAHEILRRRESMITETTFPHRDTAAYRIRRNAPFSDSPAFYEFDHPGERVHLLRTTTRGQARGHAPKRLRIVPLKSATASTLADMPVEKTVSEPVTVFVATPRAVLVTRTHGPAKVRIVETTFPKPAASEKAPPLLLATTAAISAEPLTRKVTQAVQTALAKPSAAKALQSTAPSAALHVFAEAKWKLPVTVLPKPAAALARRPVVIGPKAFLSELRIPELPEFHAVPQMRLVKPRFLQALSLGRVEVSRLREVEIPTKPDLKTVGDRLKRTGEIAGKAARAKKQPGGESMYQIRTAGPIRRADGFAVQKFSVMGKPGFDASLLDLKEFEVIKPPDRKKKDFQPAFSKPLKADRDEVAPEELSVGGLAVQLVAAVTKAVGPAYGRTTALPAVQSGEMPMALAAPPAMTGADRKRELETLLEPVAAFFKPVFSKAKAEPKPHVTGGAMAAPGLFDIGGGELVAVLPRGAGRKRSVISDAVEQPFEPADTLKLFPTSVGWMFAAPPSKEKAFHEIARASGLVVKPLSKGEATVVAAKSEKDAKREVDEAALVSTSSLKSRETEQLWRALTKEAELAESKAYPSLAGHAETPVRKRRKTEAAPAKPEPAKPKEIKKVSSDPLHDFDETVLDEIMFALKRRMASEAEGRGGYE